MKKILVTFTALCVLVSQAAFAGLQQSGDPVQKQTGKCHEKTAVRWL